MDRDELSETLRAAYAAAPRDATPSPELLWRTTSALRRHGAIGGRSRMRVWLIAAGMAVAAAGLGFALGFRAATTSAREVPATAGTAAERAQYAASLHYEALRALAGSLDRASEADVRTAQEVSIAGERALAVPLREVVARGRPQVPSASPGLPHTPGDLIWF